MKQVFFFLPLLFLSFALTAQAGKLTDADRNRIAEAEKELLRLSYAMHTDSSDEARFTACKALIKGLVSALKTPNSYHYDFSKLKGVSVVDSPEDDYRFFTWELHVSRDVYRHYGAIQYNSSDLKLLPLIDRGAQLRQNPETALTTNEDWLGYVVYKIIPGGIFEGRTYHFLFGYDRYGATSRQKFLDAFYFDREGKPHFGLPVFVTHTPEGHPLEDRTRLLLEYSAEANVAMRHNPETGRIIYENLILTQGPNGEPLSVPDGSYHALELGKDGRWHENSKVFSHTYEKAPVPRVKEKERKDVIGRPKPGG